MFFDLSIFYQDPGAAPSAKQAEAAKAARLKAAVKAMELGYTGVAYDRHISGVMSDRDRCTIAPFPLSSLLKVAPVLSASARFHRELLGVPLSAPFRQYRRLTVAVESAAQAAALNSGNSILKTYDIVAVRPLSQTTFELACKTSEVHLITIDFSQKLPFHLKGQLSNVQNAIKRGIYFEICYSHLIGDAQSRRQVLSGAKVLVDCTRGKNIIFSSAASSVEQIRGPCDVANMSCLFGLSIERAKMSISINCRSLVISAFRKRHFFMGAIKVERISTEDQHKLDEERLDNWNCWDPISSGEGVLPSVDDVFSDIIKVPGKCFSADHITVNAQQALQNTLLLHVENSNSLGSLFSASEKPYFFSAVKEAQSKEKPGEPIRRIDVASIPLEVAPLKDTPPQSEVETTFINSKLTLSTEYGPSEHIRAGSVMASDYNGTSVTHISSDGCIGQQDDEVSEDQLIDISMEIDKEPYSDGKTIASAKNTIILPNNAAVDEPILLSESPQRMSLSMNTFTTRAGLHEDEIDKPFYSDSMRMSSDKNNILSSNATVDDPILLSESPQRRMSLSINPCTTEAGLHEDPRCWSPTACHTLGENIVEFEAKQKVGTVSDRSVIGREGLIIMAKEEENIVPVRKIQWHKHKSGKVVQRMKGQSYQLPFKCLLKPLLLKKNGKQRKASRKHHINSSGKK